MSDKPNAIKNIKYRKDTNFFNKKAPSSLNINPLNRRNQIKNINSINLLNNKMNNINNNNSNNKNINNNNNRNINVKDMNKKGNYNSANNNINRNKIRNIDPKRKNPIRPQSKDTNNKQNKQIPINNINNINQNVFKCVIQNEEYIIKDTYLLSIIYPLLKNAYRKHIIDMDLSNNIYLFPNSVDKLTFENFLTLINYLSKNNEKNVNRNQDQNENLQIEIINNLDYNDIEKIIGLSCYLNVPIIINYIFVNVLLYKINNDTCISIIKCLFSILSNMSNNELDINAINKILKECYNCCAINLMYIITKQEKDLLDLNNDVIESIINIYFKNCNNITNPNINNMKINNKIIFELLVKIRKIKNDIFLLLENERKSSLEKFRNEISTNTNLNGINNKIKNSVIVQRVECQDISKSLYQETNYIYEKYNINTFINYEYKTDTLNLGIQILKNTDTKDNRDNIINNVPSNINNNDDGNNSIVFTGSKYKNQDKNNNQNYINTLEMKDMIDIINTNNYDPCSDDSNSLGSNTNNNINNFNNNEFYNNYNYNYGDTISLLNMVEIYEINYKSKINFNYIHTGNKIKILITQIKNFYQLYNSINNRKNNYINLNSETKENNNNYNLLNFTITIRIHLKINYIYPYLINDIAENFYKYTTTKNNIQIIPKLVLKLILNNKNLNKRNEDDFLNTILLWLNSKSIENFKTSKDLLYMIEWEKITTKKLIDTLMFKNKLFKQLPELYNFFYTEIKSRLNIDIYKNAFSNNQFSISITSNSKNDLDSSKPINNFTDNMPAANLNTMLKRIINNSEYFTLEIEKYKSNGMIKNNSNLLNYKVSINNDEYTNKKKRNKTTNNSLVNNKNYISQNNHISTVDNNKKEGKQKFYTHKNFVSNISQINLKKMSLDDNENNMNMNNIDYYNNINNLNYNFNDNVLSNRNKNNNDISITPSSNLLDREIMKKQGLNEIKKCIAFPELSISFERNKNENKDNKEIKEVNLIKNYNNKNYSSMKNLNNYFYGNYYDKSNNKNYTQNLIKRYKQNIKTPKKRNNSNQNVDYSNYVKIIDKNKFIQDRKNICDNYFRMNGSKYNIGNQNYNNAY